MNPEDNQNTNNNSNQPTEGYNANPQNTQIPVSNANPNPITPNPVSQPDTIPKRYFVFAIIITLLTLFLAVPGLIFFTPLLFLSINELVNPTSLASGLAVLMVPMILLLELLFILILFLNYKTLKKVNNFRIKILGLNKIVTSLFLVLLLIVISAVPIVIHDSWSKIQTDKKAQQEESQKSSSDYDKYKSYLNKKYAEITGYATEEELSRGLLNFANDGTDTKNLVAHLLPEANYNDNSTTESISEYKDWKQTHIINIFPEWDKKLYIQLNPQIASVAFPHFLDDKYKTNFQVKTAEVYVIIDGKSIVIIESLYAEKDGKWYVIDFREFGIDLNNLAKSLKH